MSDAYTENAAWCKEADEASECCKGDSPNSCNAQPLSGMSVTAELLRFNEHQLVNSRAVIQLPGCTYEITGVRHCNGRIVFMAYPEPCE